MTSVYLTSNDVKVSSEYTNLFNDTKLDGYQTIFIKETENKKAKGIINYVDIGNEEDGYIITLDSYRGVLPYSSNFTFSFPKSENVYEFRKIDGIYGVRLAVGSEVVTNFTVSATQIE